MQLGIGTYTYGWASGIFRNESADAAARAGYRNLSAQDLIDRALLLNVPLVQICVLPDLTSMNHTELVAVRQYAVAGGIGLEIGTKGSDPGHLLRFLEIAHMLDAHLVRTIFMEPSPGLVEERRRIDQVADRYADAGVMLAIENYETTSVLELRSFVRDLDNVNIGVCLDTTNSLGRAEGVREVIEALMPFTKCLHVKDFRVVRHESNTAFTVLGVPAGHGLLDLPEQLRMLQAACPDASIVLEQWTPYQKNFVDTIRLEQEWAAIGVGNLNLILAQVQGQQ